MKTYIYSLILFACLIASGCSKDEDFVNYKIADECQLISLSHAVYGTDSIFYNDGQISSIIKYKNVNGVLIQDKKLSLVNTGDEIRVYSAENGVTTEVSSFIFRDSLLTEIRAPKNRLMINFHYNEDLLSYFIYSRITGSETTMEKSDSVAVFYDKHGQNITELRWYRISGDITDLVYSSKYTFDDKKSPFKNSVYYLTRNWTGVEDIVFFFDSNNHLSIGSHLFTYGYDVNEYPLYMENSGFGRTLFHYKVK